jgi:hypothetical protein
MAVIQGKGNSNRPDYVPTGKSHPVDTKTVDTEEKSPVDKGKDFVKTGEKA